ncbi:hypothetical protein FF38_01897 [Lucilia cuprina]|uniref:Uncharacterized protein n=1 Tax=Lucilia cuprina TaxID=7375 RepID=A0A0L0BS68_LUCCU|nr:hypothetical protein FF38_01897 [Lucilia cuprina]
MVEIIQNDEYSQEIKKLQNSQVLQYIVRASQELREARGEILKQAELFAVYTSQGSSLRRVVGSSGQVRKEPDGENRWQRALDSGRANNAVYRGRGNPQLATNMPRQQRSQRRRGPDTSASIGRIESSSAAQRIANRRVGQAVVLEEMAAYFRTQADVLAILGERLRPGPSTEDAMVRGNARRRRRQNRRRTRRQSSANAISQNL